MLIIHHSNHSVCRRLLDGYPTYARQRAEGSPWDSLEWRIAMDLPMNINHTSLVPNTKCKYGRGVKVERFHMCVCTPMSIKQRTDIKKAERYLKLNTVQLLEY